MALGRSQIFVQLSGSVGGLKYSRNRYAAIVLLSRIKPVDPNTNPLELQRSYFNAAVSHWKGLTALQRKAWDDFAGATPWQNKLGETVYLTGQAMYIGQSTASVSAFGVSYRPNYIDAPCVPGMFPTPTVGFACCANPVVGVIVTVGNQHPTNLMNAVVRISPPQSPAVKFYSGPWDTAARILLSGIAPDAVDTAEFCPLCEGKFFFQIRAFDGTDNNNMSTLTHGGFIACTTAP